MIDVIIAAVFLAVGFALGLGVAYRAQQPALMKFHRDGFQQGVNETADVLLPELRRLGGVRAVADLTARLENKGRAN